jgi:hypothetical protein
MLQMKNFNFVTFKRGRKSQRKGMSFFYDIIMLLNTFFKQKNTKSKQ